MSSDASQPRGPDGAREALTGQFLARNMSWNMLGLALPLVLAVISAPVLLHRLGNDRFGILLLSWTFVGYFSLFDLGLGRALTQAVATRLGSNSADEVPSVVWTSMVVMTATACCGMVIAFALAPWLSVHLVRPPTSLQTEALGTLYLLALSVPAVVAGAGFRGVLEAAHRFDYVNLVRVPLGIITYLGPLLVLPFTRNISVVVAVLVLGRFVACGVQGWLCVIALPQLRSRPTVQYGLVPSLLKFGGWLTAWNVLVPVMTYVDRFAISALLSVAAVAYYAVPFDTVTKLFIIPSAINYVLFPAFASVHGRASHLMRSLISRGLRYSLLGAFPACLTVMAFAPEGLTVWLGPEFAAHSALIARLITLGALANIVAQTPITLIQAVGRPDIITKILFVELPLYVLALAALLRLRGIDGAAMAWAFRTTIEAAVLVALAARMVGAGREIARLLPAVGLVLLGAAIYLYPMTLEVRSTVFSLELIGFGFASWRWLVRAERIRAVRWLREMPLFAR